MVRVDEMSIHGTKRLWGDLSVGRDVLMPCDVRLCINVAVASFLCSLYFLRGSVVRSGAVPSASENSINCTSRLIAHCAVM